MLGYVWLSPVGEIGTGIEGGCNMQMFEQRNAEHMFVSMVLAHVISLNTED